MLFLYPRISPLLPIALPSRFSYYAGYFFTHAKESPCLLPPATSSWILKPCACNFSDELNKVLGPVKTQYGYHLIEVTSRW